MEQATDGIVHNVPTNMSNDSRKWVVHENNLGIEVDCTSDVQTLFLTSRNGDTSLTNLRLVTMGKHFEIRSQSAGIDNLVIPFLVKWSAKDNVLFHGCVLN